MACFGCNVSPPTLYIRVIRNLGATLRKISSNKLTNEALNKKGRYQQFQAVSRQKNQGPMEPRKQ
jgi:hypothetical protein